jgi:hypothetical protein
MAALWGKCASLVDGKGQPRVEAGNVARNASPSASFVAFFGADELRRGRHVARFTIVEGNLGFMGIGVVDASVAAKYHTYHRDVAWAYSPAFGIVEVYQNPLMSGTEGKQLGASLVGKAAGATVELTVDMDARKMLVSVNGASAEDAGVELPTAVRLWCWMYASGDAVRLESVSSSAGGGVSSSGGAAAPSRSGVEKRLAAVEVDAMKVSRRPQAAHRSGRGIHPTGLRQCCGGRRLMT